MPGEFLLDTSVIIPLFRGDAGVRQRLEEAERVFLSPVVLGELHFGAEGSRRPRTEVEQIEAFSSLCVLLPCDGGTAKFYGRVKQDLRRRGRPIPENDLWKAATAVQHQLILATRDEHFREIEGLTAIRW